MAAHVFTKRSGTTDRGHDFENYFIANLLLKLITDDEVEDFFLSSDDNDYGSFDDVVVEVVYRSGHRQIYAIQLKHLEERNLTVAALESDKGKFAIKNYFKNFNFRNDYTAVILYTNASLQATNGQILNLENFEKTDIWKTSLESVLTTSENGEFYYLGTENSTDFRKFCKHFSLYTNQANVTQLEKQTRDSFQKLFGCKASAFTEYVNFVIKWCKIKGKKEKLTKKWIRNVIAVCILEPFVQPLSFSSREVNENMKTLRDAMLLFQITVFNSGCYEKVRELWSDFKQELTDVKRINMKYSVTSDFIESVDDLDGREKETSILLWLLDKCPLILAEAPEVYRAIEVFKEKKFIIFNPKMLSQKNSVFEKLSDLVNYSTIYKNILNKFTCSLQGKEKITLKNLVYRWERLGVFLTTNELLQMVDGLLIIGGGMEVLPACHVPRRIWKNIVNAECLVQFKNDALIVIDNFPKTTNLEKYGEFYVTTIEEYLKNGSKKENEVYLCEGKSPRAHVEELCRKTNKDNYYHFCYLSERLLEYISSSNINEIEYFIKNEYYVEECELYQNNVDINIICANPGMGKTTLMKNLKNNTPSSLWTVLIYARNYSSYFRKKDTSIYDFLNHCLIETGKNVSVFDQNVIRLLMYQKRIVILWDGLDEMVEENLEIVKKIIHDANAQGYKQWVTSRNHLKSTLEDEFNTLSRSLEEFDEKEQKIYIGERLNFVGEAVDDIFTKIQKNIALFPNNNILGIPLQSFMLTELFLQDKDKYLNLLNEIVSLADLYEHFVAEKFNVYYKEKQNLVEINEVLRERNEQDKKFLVNSYEVAAIHTYFYKKVVSKLQIDSQNLLRSKKDPVGLIIKITNDGLSEFCHNSFGEYFAASYLTKNRSDFFVTFDLLFESKYDNIRLFYDLILAKGCKGHISVLYRNYELLTTCTDSEICTKDQLGRSTLEVACSWRKKYPLLRVTRHKLGNFEFKKKLSLENPNAIINLQKIISFLVTHFTLEQNRYNLFLNEDLLLPFVSLKKDVFKKIFNLGENHTISVLLYAVALDFVTIFVFFRDIPFIYCTHDDNLLTISLQYKSINCLKKIVSHQPYKIYISKKSYVLYSILNILQNNSLDIMIDVIRDINIKDLQQYTLLHHICSENNYEVASWLLKNGASMNLIVNAFINNVDQYGKTPIHYASLGGSVELMTLLIENGADVNAKDKEGNTPLHLARKSYQVTKILIDNGADLLALNNNKQSVVHLTSDSEILHLLIKSGVDLHSQDGKGKMLIHYVCSNKNDYSADFLDILIQNISSVNVIDEDGDSIHRRLTDKSLVDDDLDGTLEKRKLYINKKDHSRKTPLHYACSSKNNSLGLVEYLMEYGSDPNLIDNNKRTPLHYACASKEKNFHDIVSILIEKGTVVNLPDAIRRLPLHYACIGGQFSIVELLVHHESNINFLDRDNMTPLYYAYKHNYPSIVNLLLENGAKINDPVDGGGKLLIHYACIFGGFEDVKLYLEKGVDVNILDNKGGSPLHYACKNNRSDIVNLLVANEANTNIKDVNGKTPLFYADLEDSRFLIENTPADVNVVDNDGLTLLHHSASNGDFQYVKLLVENGAKINIADGEGRFPIHLARSRKFNFDEMVKLLTDEDCTIDALDKENKTPAHYACQDSNWDLLQSLITVKANLEVADKNGRLPIHFACSSDFYHCSEIVLTLINKGVAFETPDNNGQFPIHYACRNTFGHDVIRVLTQAGASINVEDNDGKSPLHHACIAGIKRNVTLLLKLGASVNASDKFKRTPLHYSSAYGHVEITEILLENGSSVNFSDIEEKLPIHYACLKVHREISDIPNSSGFSFEEIISYKCCRRCRQEVKQLVMAQKHKSQKKHSCDKNSYQTVEVLIKHKSIVDAVDNKGKKPSDYARKYCPKVVKDLVNRES